MGFAGRPEYNVLNKKIASAPNQREFNNRPYFTRNKGLESLFKDRMSREELLNLKKDYLNPVFKNCMTTCTIRVPSGQQRIYRFDEKDKIYIRIC